MPLTWWRRRRSRIRESRDALARQERLEKFIDLQRQEAAEVSAWARRRLEVNHLSSLFEGMIQGRDIR